MAVWALIVLGNLRQQPGRTTWDTKFDLTADPGTFLERALHLWNPDASFGELQNQAYGYLFPQGPFFLLGDAVGVPDWVWQRLWSALLLIAAYEGVRAVARALGLNHLPATLGGLVYAFSPRLLGAVGVLTGEILPTAVLPWVVLPLVLARTGRLGPRQAGLWSGVALLFMSGVNAAGLLATFPLLIALVAEQWRREHGRRLAAWWAVGVAGATLWWVVPLLLLGRYSPPFLDFIETSASTTSSTSWGTSVRGTEHWLAYFTIGDQAWWPAANAIATQPWAIVLGALVAAVGLVGLVHRDLPARPAWVASALVGLLCLTAANPATLGSLVDGPMRELLDGALAPFRNVHKVDPLVRLPLALGFAQAVALAVARLRDVELRRIVVGLTAVGVLATGAPLYAGDLRMPGFTEVPDAWSQTADYLADQPDSRALVLPGSGFGLQSWGWTIDEPLQGVARSAWVTRSQVPLVPGPTARYLDTIERRIASGEGSPALAAMLARAGITHVVLRRDLDPFRTETVPADRAEAALLRSPGLDPVAGFGVSGFADIPLISVYAVEGPEGTASSVDLLDPDVLPRVVGAPDDLLPALETDALGSAPALIVPDADDGATVVGDSYARVERQFGRVHDSVGDVMALGDPSREDRPSLDFPGVDGVPLVTSDLLAGGSVTASSSMGYSDEFGPVRPEYAPSAAFDGNLSTAWRSGSLQAPTEQWIQVALDHPVSGGTLAVQFLEVPSGARVVRARVLLTDTDGSVSRAVYGVPADNRLLVPMPQRAIHEVRIEVVEARGENPALGHVAVAEIGLPGVVTGRTLDLPVPVGADDTVVLRAEPPRRACVDIGLGANCTPAAVRRPVDDGRIDRTVEVTEAGEWELSGSVVAVPGRASAALLAPVNGAATVRAASVLAGDPAVSGVFAFDGDANTPWLSGVDAASGRLVLTWNGARTIRGLSFLGTRASSAVAPQGAVLRSRGVERRVDFAFSPTFEPFRARGRLVITFPRPDTPSAADRPIGVGEIQVDGLEGLEYVPAWSGPTGAMCGLGPQVVVDGEVHDTEVEGTLDDVRLGTPLTWRVCDGDVVLEPGRHRVSVAPTFQFQATNLTLRPADAEVASTAGDAASDRSLEVDAWGATRRTVAVGPGDDAVLRVAESLNDGWVATLDGDTLEEVTLDGWQQGYLVPAGEGGTVVLEYRPDGTYRAGLLVGLVVALLLVAAAVVGQVRDRRRVATEPAAAPPVGPRLRGAGVGAAGLGLLVLGGPVAGLGFALAAWARWRRVVVALGAGLVLASGPLAAWAESTAAGRPPNASIWTAALGVGLLVGSVAFPAPTGAVAWGRVLPDALRGSWSWLRANPVVVAGVLLIVVQGVVRWWLADGSYYWQDDFVHLDLAHRTGLSEELVFRQHNEHVEFGPFALFWLLSLHDGLSFTPAVIALVALQSLAAVLFWTLLLQLFGRSRWLLVPLAAYLFTPISIVGATWLASGVEAFSLQSAMFGALNGLVRFRRTGRARWAVVSLLAFAAGVLCWQKAAVILPVLLAVDVLLLGAGTTLRARLRALVAAWWFWLALVVVLGAYVGVYLSLTTSESFGSAVDGSPWEAVQDMLLRVFVPGLLGGPWTDRNASNSLFPITPLWIQLVSLAVLVAVLVVSLVRRGRGALAGWVLAAGYVAGDTALLFAGRTEFLGLVSRDPRYFTDAVPVVLLGICAAFATPRRDAPDESADVEPCRRRPRRARPAVTLVPAALAVALAASGLSTTWLLAPTMQHEEARDYVGNLVLGVNSDPGAPVASTFAPDDIALLRSTEMLLGAFGYEQRMDQPGASPRVVSGTGAVVPAFLDFVDLDEEGPRRDCGWAVGAEPTPLVGLESSLEQRALELGVVSGSTGVIHVLVDGVEQAVAYPAGASTLYFSVTRLDGPVLVWVTDTADGACVTRVRRGALWPVGE